MVEEEIDEVKKKDLLLIVEICDVVLVYKLEIYY